MQSVRPLLRPLLRSLSVQRPSPLAVSVEEAGTMLRGLDHSKAMWDALRAGENPLGARSPLLPTALERAGGAFAFPAHEVTGHAVSACGTHKLLLKLGDGLKVETVLIPMQVGSATLHLSLPHPSLA